jgi:hypothetical protein
MDLPVVAFRVGSIFFNEQFKASARLFEDKRITPDMLDVDGFLCDYERMFLETESIGQTAFWVAEPFNAVPWLEAIMGCPIYGTASSLISHPVESPFDAIDRVIDDDNPWVKKYFEFARKLVKLSGGRFPVGQSLLRGMSDVAGALIGQKEFIYAAYDEPEKLAKLMNKIADVFLYMIRRLYEEIPPYQGGYTIGLFHVWTPDQCIWYQEDLVALLSPAIFRDFIRQPDERLCAAFPYSMMHVHPSAFSTLDDIMTLEKLTAVEVNKDTGGPNVRQMLPQIRKIVGKKNVIIWGELDREDIDCIYEELPPKSVMLHIVMPQIGDAQAMMEYILKKHRT